MVRFVVEDGEGAVELLHEEEAYHLVVEGHLRQGYLVVGGGIDGGGKAKSPSHDKGKGAGAGVHLFLQVLREAHGSVLLAVLVEQHDAVDALQAFEQQGGFALLDFVGRGVALVFEGGDDFEVEVDIVPQPLDVDVDAFLQVGGVGLGDYY